MRPWTRTDFVEALGDDELKEQVCKTLDIDAAKVSAEDVVDAKLYYSGINARWFFNLTVEEIKENSRSILQRMSPASQNAGISSERAVNSAYVTFWDDDREIKLFTSRHLAILLANSNHQSKKFFELYPMMKGRLGNGAPGEIFEADFLVHLEQSHDIAIAQRYVMGDMAQPVDVILGKDISNGEDVRWSTGKLSSLPKNPRREGAQPMSLLASQVKNRVSQWFVPEDLNQPFLDFFVLIPVPASVEWILRVIQNTVSKKHTTDLEQLKRVLVGVEKAGFGLAGTVDVIFVIENNEQRTLGSTIDGELVEIPKQSPGRSQRGTNLKKQFKINVMRVVFARTASVPE